MNLYDKARLFEKLIKDKLITKEGTLAYLYELDTNRSTGFADMAIWTGVATATFFFKYFITRNKNDKQLAIEFLRGLHSLQTVTGKKGLLSRGLTSEENEFDFISGPDSHHITHNSKLYKWNGDVSSDQLIGVILGYTIAWHFLDKGDKNIRNEIKDYVFKIADHLIENNLKIIDVDGKMTKHGNLTGNIFKGSGPLDALIACATISLAAKISNDLEGERYDIYQYYKDRMKKQKKRAIKARGAFWEPIVSLIGKTNHSDNNLAFLSHLVLQFTDAKSTYTIKSIDKSWNLVKNNNVPFFNFIYYNSCPDISGDKLKESIKVLEDFVESRTDINVTKEMLKDYKIYFHKKIPFKSRSSHNLQSWKPLDIKHQSMANDFKWKGNPFEINERVISGSKHTTSGIDFLMTYWYGKVCKFLK
tara:strand:- start:2656 stop:3909 length:1254 start_codon:yes stop_codon:yes gene_type:complete